MNMLGIRQPEIYGHETYEDLKAAEREGAQAIFEGFDPDGAERKSERKEDTP